MKQKFFYFSFLLLFIACQAKPVDLGLATPYFPSSEELRKGYVYKYYAHQVPKNTNDDISTDIRYRKFQFVNPDILEYRSYDASFGLNWYYKYQVADNQFRIMDSYVVINGDTLYPKWRNHLALDWANQTAFSDFDLTYTNGGKSTNISLQTGIKDTIINENVYQLISKTDSTTYYSYRGDTIVANIAYTNFYEKDKGYVRQISNSEKHITTYELVEKMSVAEFESRSKHGKKRIGYIDPTQTLDDHSDFKLCNPEYQIGDYYYCKKRGELIGGKGSWWRVLKRKLNPHKLKNESGLLTFRFVINCAGASGRFVVNGADLAYNEKVFDPETVQHLYDIVSGEIDWQHCEGYGRNLDTYAFITFKLKDGEIIELLP